MPDYYYYPRQNTRHYHGTDHDKFVYNEQPLATITAHGLEQVWERTNHINRSWFGESLEHVRLHIRSAMVGDLFVERNPNGKNKPYVVASFGFDEYTGTRNFDK